jgi:hypothetical protein
MFMMMVMTMIVLRAGCWVLGARAGCSVLGARCCAVFMDDELRGRDAGAQDPRGADVIAGDGQRAERAFQLVERQAGVDQRAEEHVAGDPGEAVEVEQSGHHGRKYKVQSRKYNVSTKYYKSGDVRCEVSPARTLNLLCTLSLVLCTLTAVRSP